MAYGSLARGTAVMALLLTTATLWAAPIPVETFAQREPGPTWPRWGRPMGEAAQACAWSVEKQGKAMVGRVTYHRARGSVLLPMPEVAVSGRPTALTMRVLGDGNGAALSVTVMDANGEWLATPGLPVTWRGWRAVKLDLTRFARSGRGDEDGVVDPPATLWTLNIEFGVPMDGSLSFADMAATEERWQPFDYLDTVLEGPTQCRVYRPEDRPPMLTLANRSNVSLPVRIAGSVAGEPVSAETLVNPAGTNRIDLPRVKLSGPVELVATLTCGAAKREVRYRYGVLPGVEALPDRYFGLGRYTLDDLLDGRLLRELPDLRAASAGWTLVRLQRSMGEAMPTAAEWADAESALSVAQAFGLRLTAEMPAEALLREGPANALVSVGLRRFAPYLAGGLVDARRLRQAELVAAATRAARAALPADRALLVRAAQAPADCAARLIDLPPYVPAPPGPFPRAWRALAALLDGPDPRPAWLLAETWPGNDLTGAVDPAAAAAQTLIAARCVPRIEAAALGRLQGSDDEGALLSSGYALSEPYLAWAVAARMLAGLEPQGVREIVSGVYEMKALGARRLRVVWSEGPKHDLTMEPDEQAWDTLGRRLTVTKLALSEAPVYLVSAKASTPPRP
ncbi:MAG: hypothetical protein HZB16_24845 [Armatimonadetes bacterium]|nr:hypothetical protein [Armatimonadota bacterium]